MNDGHAFRKAAVLAAFLVCCLHAAAQESPMTVGWLVESSTERGFDSVFEFTNVSGTDIDSDWTFYFNVMPIVFTAEKESGFTVEPVLKGNCNYWKLSPDRDRRRLPSGEAVRVRLHSDDIYAHPVYSPSGGHLVMAPGSAPVPAPIVALPSGGKELYGISRRPDYADGGFIYRGNEALSGGETGGVYGILPSLKSVSERRGTAEVPEKVALTFTPDAAKAAAYLRMKLAESGISCVENAGFRISISTDASLGENPERYSIRVRKSGISVAAQSCEGAMDAAKTLSAVLKRALLRDVLPAVLPCADIEDWPDLHHRGFMLDLARNYTPYGEVLKLIDILAEYKINVLQYHFNDDDAWRLEIPGLPDLTEMASRKGCTCDELASGCLVQSFAGNGNPDDLSTTANGHVTREQFVSLLKYADARGVSVVPELEMPGHSRAAIMAMRHMASVQGADGFPYRLWDDSAGTSGSVSVQGWGDNALCVAEEGVFRFWDKVVSELQLMYADAGVPLHTVHIGGDEVSHGVWMASPEVRRLMSEENLPDCHAVHAWFVRKMAGMLSSRGIRIAGWQEIATCRTPEHDAGVVGNVAYVNVWDTLGDRDRLAYEFANDGYPVVLTNVRNFYLDMYYAASEREPGHIWGGPVDEFAGLACQPFDNYRSARFDQNGLPHDLQAAGDGKPELLRPENIIGVEAALWTETIRGAGMVEYYVFPKIFGLVERGWNAFPSWGGRNTCHEEMYGKACADFNMQIGLKELPYLASRGVNSRIAPPGAVVKDGMLHVNTRYPGMTVRYTLDGTEPDMRSSVWTGPVPVYGHTKAKVKAWYCGGESVTVCTE